MASPPKNFLKELKGSQKVKKRVLTALNRSHLEQNAIYKTSDNVYYVRLGGEINLPLITELTLLWCYLT